MGGEFVVKSGMTDAELGRLYRLTVFELEDFAMFAMTVDGYLTSWNRGVEKAFGYSEQEWVGKHASVIFTEEDRTAGVIRSEMEAAENNGRSVDVRWHQRKDGSRVFLRGVLMAMRNEQGELVGFCKTVFDDTTQKRLEDALTQSNADLQQFALMASHDLQEPVRTLSSFTELVSQRLRGRLDADTDQMMEYMIQATQRMSVLISDLLEFSRLAQDEPRAESVVLDYDVESAITLLRGPIEATGAVITHDTLPVVRMDRNQMVRLFQNLISNAIKFRKPGEPPRVHIEAERCETEWIIRVVDQGIGFPQEQAEVIFKAFKRLHSSRDYAGSGIGLAACKRIVESYGGRIGAESKEGQGATFWFSIPHQWIGR